MKPYEELVILAMLVKRSLANVEILANLIALKVDEPTRERVDQMLDALTEKKYLLCSMGAKLFGDTQIKHYELTQEGKYRFADLLNGNP